MRCCSLVARAAVAVLALWLCAGAAQAATCPGSGGKRCAYDRIAVYGHGAPGELHTPLGLALSPDGRIYVADANARNGLGQLVVFDRAGAYFGKLVTPSPWFSPVDVGVSSDGAVYALDGSGTQVHRFDATGGYALLQMPYGFSGTPTVDVRADRFAVQADGTFWMLYRHGLVEHRSATGALLGSFTVPPENMTGIGVAADGNVFIGRQNGGFTEYTPGGTAVRSISSYPGFHLAFAGDGDVISSWGSTITRAERDGSGYTEIGSSGGAPGQLSQVAGIAVAPPGALAAQRPGEEAYVVADRDNHRVQVLATDGTALAVIGAPQGSTLLAPSAAWGTSDGGLVVADTMNRRVVRFSAAGAFAGRADGGLDGWPRGGARNPATGDNIVMNGAFAVRRFGTDGTLLGGWPMPGVVEGASNSGFGGAIATAADGTIWAAHSPAPRGGSVVAYSATGVALRRIADGHIDNPIGLAAGPGGELYVVEGGGVNSTAVDVFGPDGTFRRRLDALGCVYAESVAVDDAGRIYAGLRNKIAIFDRSGALLARFGEPGSALGQFDGTQLSMLGNVLTITEQDNNRITRVRIDPAAFGAPESQPCGSVQFAATTIPVRSARAQVPLGCSGTFAAACEGAVALLRAGLRSGRRPKAKDVLASTSFRVGRSAIVALKLKKAERRTLSRKRRLKARIIVQPRRGAPITRRVTLTLPARPKASKRR